MLLHDPLGVHPMEMDSSKCEAHIEELLGGLLTCQGGSMLVWGWYEGHLRPNNKVRHCIRIILIAGWLRNRTGTGNRNRQNRFSRNRKRNRNRRNRFPGTETGTGTVLSFKNVLKHRKTLFVEEPPEPKTGTDRTFPPPNRNRTTLLSG